MDEEPRGSARALTHELAGTTATMAMVVVFLAERSCLRSAESRGPAWVDNPGDGLYPDDDEDIRHSDDWAMSVVQPAMTAADPVTSPRRESGNSPSFSLVIAVFNEAENVAAVTEEVLRSVGGKPRFELVYVDDGSTDDTADRLRTLRQAGDPIRLLRHDRRCGKTAALITGIAASRAPWIVTMDGDGQDNPGDIPGMLQSAWQAGAPSPLVAGIRARRRDPLRRRVATRVANGLRQASLKDGCPDTACGLKAFERDVFLRLPAFEGMHRFLPALFQTRGHPLICYPVRHRPRLKGSSKYTNFGRAMVGVTDMLGVMWLRRRMHVPLRVTEE